MAEYGDDILDDVMNEAADIGLDQKTTSALMRNVLQRIASERLMRGRQDDQQAARAAAIQDKAGLKLAYEDQQREALLDAAAPPDPGLPITWGRDPKSKADVWNNLGWIANEPAAYDLLQGRQRSLAKSYNEAALAQLGVDNQGNRVGTAPTPMTLGRADPFMPPGNVMASRRAEEAKNAVDTRALVKLSALMAANKIPVETQQVILYQRFPGLNRRKLDDEIAKAEALYRINQPNKAEEADRKRDKDATDAEYKREVADLRRMGLFQNEWKAIDMMKDVLESTRGMPGFTPQAAEKLGTAIARRTLDLVEREEAAYKAMSMPRPGRNSLDIMDPTAVEPAGESVDDSMSRLGRYGGAAMGGAEAVINKKQNVPSVYGGSAMGAPGSAESGTDERAASGAPLVRRTPTGGIHPGFENGAAGAPPVPPPADVQGRPAPAPQRFNLGGGRVGSVRKRP